MGHPATEPVSDSAYWVEVVSSAADLLTHQTQWKKLAYCALTPNPFYEPDSLLAAIEAFGGSVEFKFLFVYMRTPTQGSTSQRLAIGFFPLSIERGFRGYPAAKLALWYHDHVSLTTPLLHPEQATRAWSMLFAWMETQSAATILESQLLLAEGPTYHALLDAMRAHRCISHSVEHYARAALVLKQCTGNDYIGRQLASKKHKELRRLQRRLGEQGTLRFKQLQANQDCAYWIDQFLALEAKSWKGKEQTAMRFTAREASYFRTICMRAYQQNRLQMLALCLDGEPLAMKCNLSAGMGLFALKIAYDKQWAKFSPGVLLELENIRLQHSEASHRWMDSCAQPDHPMIDHLWGERRVIQHLLITPQRRLGIVHLGVITLLRNIKRLFRG